MGNDFVSSVLLDARSHAHYSVQPSNSENDQIRAALPGGFQDLRGRLAMSHLGARAATQVSFLWNQRFELMQSLGNGKIPRLARFSRLRLRKDMKKNQLGLIFLGQ